jgi:hypothetical protein
MWKQSEPKEANVSRLKKNTVTNGTWYCINRAEKDVWK